MKVKKEHIKKAHAIIKSGGGWRENHVISEPCNYYYVKAGNYTVIEIIKKSMDGGVYGTNDCCQVNITTGQITG